MNIKCNHQSQKRFCGRCFAPAFWTAAVLGRFHTLAVGSDSRLRHSQRQRTGAVQNLRAIQRQNSFLASTLLLLGLLILPQAGYCAVPEGLSAADWSSIRQQSYLKASNTEANDLFGTSVAVSGDTVVVGATGEDSNATAVNGDGSDNSAFASGAAYVFVRSDGVWIQQAYLKASNAEADDVFGRSVGVSGDTVAVGAHFEASTATGVNGDGSDNSAFASGAAYVFVRSGTNWTQQSYLKASNTEENDRFGISLAVSGDTVVIGTPFEASNASGIDGDDSDNSASFAGVTYIFTAPDVVPPELRLTAARNGDMLQLTATGTTNTQWRLEFCEALTGTNAWQAVTTITLGVGPTLIQQPLDSTNRFYRGACTP